MLAVRIIPVLLCRNDTLVKGKRFNAWRSVGHVSQAARIYAMRGVDELVVLDIGATPANREPDIVLVEKISAGNFTPLAYGGGIKTMFHVEQLLKAGADKLIIGHAAVRPNLDFLTQASKAVGCQAITVALDYIGGTHRLERGKLDTCVPVVISAKELEEAGAGEILLTSIHREGTMEGYDLEMLHAVSQAVSIPVVAHGGCGSYQHMAEAIDAGASAVAAGALFQFTESTPKEAAEYLKAKGYEVRT